ncbi:MAG TPA: hypothetical protein VHY80_16720 [Stellaceae bacterium]|jgi:hypothetical protein|nr:hypothetical protein [Stellaceae bacterium]
MAKKAEWRAKASAACRTLYVIALIVQASLDPNYFPRQRDPSASITGCC